MLEKGIFGRKWKVCLRGGYCYINYEGMGILIILIILMVIYPNYPYKKGLGYFSY